MHCKGIQMKGIHCNRIIYRKNSSLHFTVMPNKSEMTSRQLIMIKKRIYNHRMESMWKSQRQFTSFTLRIDLHQHCIIYLLENRTKKRKDEDTSVSYFVHLQAQNTLVAVVLKSPRDRLLGATVNEDHFSFLSTAAIQPRQ